MALVKWSEYCAARAQAQAPFGQNGVNLVNLDRTGDGPIRMGVQWASCGTVSPEDAVRFAGQTLDAAVAARTFRYNGCVIDYGG